MNRNTISRYLRKVAGRIAPCLHDLNKRLKPIAHNITIVVVGWLRQQYKGYMLPASRRAVVWVRLAHFQVARRPHEHLRTRWRWYDAWHRWNYHKHVHALVVAAYFLIIGVYVVGVYQRTHAASDLADSWNFSNASNFSLGSGVETNGSSARLKAQNYSADANTMGLYHFDESGGTTVSDSSANGNTGTASNATFGTGNLNNGLSFNGTDSQVSVPDSSSLSLSQQNTVEAWTKLNSSLSAGSSNHRQTIVDKGDYQLYYDNETGKLTYEMANSTANTWTQVGGNDLNGGWDLNGKRSVNAITKMGSNIYAAIGMDTGDAEVWEYNGSIWTKIGGGPTPVNDSWGAQTYEGVYALTTDGSNLYAGLGTGTGDGEVWKWNGSTWTKIGGDSLNNGWTNYAEQVWSLDYFGGNLYAGIGSSANDAEVWRWDGSTWTKIGGDSANGGWTTNYEIVASLTNDGTNLYAGLGVTAGDGEVWKWNGSTWTKIGGDSLNGGWDATIETVRSLRYFGGKLYAGLGDSTGDADVWSWSGSSWTQIGGDGVNSSWAAATYEQIGSFAYDGTNLYAGLGTGNGDGEVWKWNGSTWTKIGGDGQDNSWTTNWGDTVNTMLWDGSKLFAGTYDSAGTGWVYTYDGTSWTLVGGNDVRGSWGYYNMPAVQVMQNVGDYLYAGLGNVAGSAEVWRWDGSTWKLIGGQEVNGSWDSNTYEQVMSMASYNGKLEVGLGTSTGDAEVWEWDGSTWTKIGGDSVNNGWNNTYEEVDSLAVLGGKLYAGLGNSTGDGEVWRWDGTGWTKIGGDSLNNGWTNYVENVLSLAVYKGNIVAGLGRSTGDAELWKWNGSTWTKIGGDGIGGSWAANVNQEVESLVQYGDKLYAGLGYTAGSASLWEYDGTSWTQIGGDDINGSWTTGTYEKLKTLVVYNGDLYAGLGNSTGDGEVWRLSGGTWTKIAGNGLNSGWPGTVEEVESFSPYKGKLYAGTGLTGNADANVWTWGNNAFLQSDTSNFDTGWHHVAATYDGITAKLYIDGVLHGSLVVSNTMPDGSRPLLIGTSYGGREYGKPTGSFDGQLDELRISDIARTGFTTKPFAVTPQTVTLANAVRQNGVWHWDGVTADEVPNGGSIAYRLSDDTGTTWKYWNGTGWVLSASTSQANDIATANAHIAAFPVTYSGVKWQAVLSGDGTQQVTLNTVGLASTSDTTAPTDNASNITALKASGGAALAENGWTNGASPVFNWTSGTDIQSGVKGYCAYLGTDDTADPVTTKGLLGTSPVATGGHCQFIVSGTSLDLGSPGTLSAPLTTNSSPYYLTLKAIDSAGNITSTSAQFHFRFDDTPPSDPSFITSPSGFINQKEVTLSWPLSGGTAPTDANSGVAGLQYRIGANGTWYGDAHTGTGDSSDLLSNDGAYTTQENPDFGNLADGLNTVYFRVWDNAGNVTTTYVTAAIKLNTSGAPSEPQNLAASPSANTANAFGFSWAAPATFVGDATNLKYCYTINAVPSATNCTFTSGGVTSLGSGAYASQPGENTVYVVAKDESGNINYGSYASTTFTANTPAPGIPVNVDIVDVSIKATSNWRLALTWDAPSYGGAGIANYKVYRSTDNHTFAPVGSSSSTTYIDAGLTQQQYYYRVRACDSTNNCGADSSIVHDLPTGKFTSPANMVAEPTVSGITTKRAHISWSTDRGSDSKVAIGTESGKYGSAEIASSDQVSAHEIDLDNLSAGTTYYFVAKWTDEDGNIGVSQEYTFKTAPAPTLKEINAISVGLANATIQFTSKNATKVSVYFGSSESFGGLQAVNTSLEESTYNVALTGLTDGTKYFYKLVSYDSEGTAYEGSIASFTTPPRPKISNLQFQPVDGEPTSTQLVTWATNVPSTSTITYGKVGTAGTDIQDSAPTTDHQLTIRDLEDDSEYFLLAQSRDDNGNLAVSDRQIFHTALDTRPPKISNITVESSIRGSGAEARGQVVVSWHTDELATSQVAYGEGSGLTTFNNRTAEDSSLSFEHIVIVSDLPTSKVYSVQPVSRDKSGNSGKGIVQSAIIGRASDSVLTIVLNTLKNVFGF